MKRISRIAALLLVVIIIISNLAACGETKPTNKVPFTEEDPGEIYFEETAQENIKTDDNGIKFADNEVLLIAKENVKKSQVEKLAEKYDAQIVGCIEVTNDYQLRFNKAYDYKQLSETVEKIKTEEIVESASISTFFETQEEKYLIPNDEQWENEWDLFEPRGNNWGAEAVYAPFVWQYRDNMTPVRVGLIDGMFNTSHNDVPFAEVFYNPDSASINSSHGTHVAGTMAATFNNGEGIAGIYPFGIDKDQNKNIYGVSLNGSLNGTSTFVWKVALSELIVRDVKVINVSMGSVVWSFLAAKDEPGYRDVFKNDADILGAFLEKLLDKGYDFVITQAAGNNRNYHFKNKDGEWIWVEDAIEKGTATQEELKDSIPGSDYDNMADWGSLLSVIDNKRVKDRIIVVGAAQYNEDQSKTKYSLADFSSTGDRVDVIAPGVKIQSAGLGEDGYEVKNGTSMAAPHVAGIAATVWSFNRDIDGARVKQIIMDSTATTFQTVENTDKRMVNMLAAVADSADERTGGNPIKNEQGILIGKVFVDASLMKDVKISAVDASNDKEIETTTPDAQGTYDFALEEGKYKVVVSLDGYETSTSEEVTVSNGSVVYLDSVYLKRFVTDFTIPTDMTITLGELGVIEPEILPEDAGSYSIKWSSSDEAVAVVNETGEAGIITTISKGTTTITAELTSNGKTITKTTSLRVASKARDTVLVLDVSGSMNGDPIEEMKKSAIQFCNDLLKDEYNNRVGIVFYDDEIITIPLTDDLDMLISRIESIDAGGLTNMEAGLAAADEMLKSSSNPNTIKNVVIMADGLPNEGKTSLSNSMPSGSYSSYYVSVSYANAVIDTAQQMMNGYNMYSLGFFHDLYDDEKDFGTALMKELTNKSDGYHQVDKAEDLQFAFGDISEDINVGSKIVINIACPVDVTVSYGTEMLSSAEGSYCDTASFGTLHLLGKNKDIKVVSLDSDKQYDVQITGTGDGKMDYSVSYFDENEQMTDQRSFESIPITRTTVIKSTTDNQDKDVELTVDQDGDGETDFVWTALQNSIAELTYEKNPTPQPEPEPEPEPVPVPQPKPDTSSVNVTVIATTVLAFVLISGIMVAVVLIATVEKKPREDVHIVVKQKVSDNNSTDDNMPKSIWIKCSKCGLLHEVHSYKEAENVVCPKCKTPLGKVDAQQPTTNTKITEKTDGSTGIIQVSSGTMQGVSITIKDGETIYLGKDKKYASIVFGAEYKNVSRIHCSVTFDAKANKYYVTDSSLNGTYFATKQRLEKGKRTPVNVNTVLLLANENCTIVLR